MASLKKSLLGGVLKIINNVAPVRRFVSKRTINSYAYKTPCRPRAISMAADYTTWQGLTDRRFTGRHLCRPSPADTPAEPDLEQVVAGTT